ncbi:hypothetical protein AVEN_234515-1 [Araneus ventricosus]|uniref:Uncharacterized protein n=1 Tax=Araneus ventricosus TaxID=182803 RepID=A0A4Y2A9M5_ARAVE|nr:hypothetical protein AVEN_234515-1 [Araneus ventricosus]
MSQQPTFRTYSSPQAVRKVKKSVPSSPRKKQAAVEKLSSHIGLLIPSTKPQKKNGLNGASAHFKNRLSIPLLFSNAIFCEWNFTASYHGKGAYDGIGAVLKHHVWKKVLQGQIIIKSAIEFFKVDAADVNIKCRFIEEKEILLELAAIEKGFE